MIRKGTAYTTNPVETRLIDAIDRRPVRTTARRRRLLASLPPLRRVSFLRDGQTVSA